MVRFLVASLMVLLVAWSRPAAAAELAADRPREGRRPNIVFIVADDLGWADLGCYGADLHETPRLDALAREGLRFTRAYAMPVCSPTRACLLTGKHAARLGMTVWRESAVDRRRGSIDAKRRLVPPITTTDLALEEVTLAEVLKSAGYLTFHIGKWHLGDADHYPETQGFDVNIGGTHWGAPESYFWPFRGEHRFDELRYVPGLGAGKPGDYLTDRLADEAIRMMDAAGDRPFFLNLWFHSPHTPIEGKPEWVEHFRGRLRPEMHHQNPGYAAMVKCLDENVGRVLDRLERGGLRERTLVIFLSDNGGYVNAPRGSTLPPTSNFPLRSGKGSLYEGGIRVPALVRFPGVTRPGSVSEQPVFCTDWFGTVAEMCGLEARSQDGVSLSGTLREPSRALERDALYFHFPHYYPTTTPVSAVLQRDWKMLEYLEDGRRELFDLARDPGEAQDLAAREPERVKELAAKLDTWRREMRAPMPTANTAR